MNIVLFEPSEIGKPLPRDDDRSNHITEILSRRVGDRFDAGVVNGLRGKGTVTAIHDDRIEFEFDGAIEEPELYPIDLVVGMTRPQTCRKILRDATAMGVQRIFFVATEKGEPSYSSSKLWTTEEWRRQLVAGAAQAFTTRIPNVSIDLSIEETMTLVQSANTKVALDNYEASSSLAKIAGSKGAVALAVGAERGWSSAERDLLRKNEFELAHLGIRPLRTETAIVAGLAILSQIFVT